MQHNVQNVYIFFLMSHGNMSCHMTTFLMSPCKLSFGRVLYVFASLLHLQMSYIVYSSGKIVSKIFTNL
jgi:hypothetical protein